MKLYLAIHFTKVFSTFQHIKNNFNGAIDDSKFKLLKTMTPKCFTYHQQRWYAFGKHCSKCSSQLFCICLFFNGFSFPGPAPLGTDIARDKQSTFHGCAGHYVVHNWDA